MAGVAFCRDRLVSAVGLFDSVGHNSSRGQEHHADQKSNDDIIRNGHGIVPNMSIPVSRMIGRQHDISLKYKGTNILKAVRGTK